MKRLRDYLQKYPNANILDVGCGQGNFIGVVTHLSNNYQTITGIDVSDAGFAKAKGVFNDDRISFRVLDGTKTDYHEQTFDIVSFSNSLHHLTDLIPLFQEISRVLKEGGIVIVNEMVNDSLSAAQESHKMLHHFAAAIDRENGIIHDETLSRSEILEVIKNNTTLSIVDTWDMEIPNQPSDREKQLASIEKIIAMLLERAKKSEKYPLFLKEAEDINRYIQSNGYDSATQKIVILKKA